MKYKIWKCEGFYAVQRRRWWGWEFLDATNAWCQWYGKISPLRFNTEKDIDEYLKKGVWIKKEVCVIQKREYREIEK